MTVTVLIAGSMLGIGAMLAAIRLVKGPTQIDRAVALGALLRWLLFGVFTFMGLALAVVGWMASRWDPAAGPHPTAHLFMIGGLLMLAASVWTLLRAALRDGT